MDLPMKRISFAALSLVISVTSAQAQTPETKNPLPPSESRPRIFAPAPEQVAPAPARPRPEDPADVEEAGPPVPQGTIVGTQPERRPEVAGPTATERRPEPLAASARVLSPPQIQSRIAEAERLLKSRPL